MTTPNDDRHQDAGIKTPAMTTPAMKTPAMKTLDVERVA